MTIAGVVTVDGVIVPGVEVAVRDPRGTVCGASGVDVTTVAGEASFRVHVYGDDDTVAGSHCAAPGEELTFEVYVPGSPAATYTQASLVFSAPTWAGATPLPSPPVFADRASLAVSIDARNRAPTASPTTLTVLEDSATPGTLTGSDPEGDSLTYAVITNGTLGTAVVTNAATGAYTYTPNPDATGVDTFTFVANDGTLSSLPATVTVTITAVNDRPAAQAGALTVAEDTWATGTLTAGDADGDPLTYAVVTNGTLGTAVVTNASTGAYTYTPTPDVTGVDTFTFVANDGILSSLPATVTVTITAVNDRPAAQAGALTVAEDTSANGTLTGGDPDGDPLTYAVVTNGTLGSAVVTNAATGAYTYTPNPDATGVDTFTFVAHDGTLDSLPATVTVTITPVNDAPVLTVTGATTVVEETLLQLSLSGTDVDGDPLTFSQIGAPAGATLVDHHDGTSTFTWTPPLGSRGGYAVTFTVADDATPAGSDSTAVQIVVTGPVVTVEVPLQPGWNLISFPVAACYVVEGSLPAAALPSGLDANRCTSVRSIADAFVLTPSGGDPVRLEQVRSFDASGVHNYDPTLDDELNDLTWVAGGYGYLVRVSAAGTASFTGERFAPGATLELDAGWHLVGYWGDGARYVGVDPTTNEAGLFPAGTTATQVDDVAAIFASLGDSLEALKSEDQDGAHTYTADGGGDLNYAGPGYGYWVKLNAGATVSFGP
jgi:VCBS repeat-containing protein